MRLIDADHFSERFDMMCDAGGVLKPVTEAVREMVKKLIDDEPTVKTAVNTNPIVKAYWRMMKVRWNDYRVEVTWKCTNCGEITSDTNDFDRIRTPLQDGRYFCQGCGAQMEMDEPGEPWLK